MNAISKLCVIVALIWLGYGLYAKEYFLAVLSFTILLFLSWFVNYMFGPDTEVQE